MGIFYKRFCVGKCDFSGIMLSCFQSREGQILDHNYEKSRTITLYPIIDYKSTTVALNIELLQFSS